MTTPHAVTELPQWRQVEGHFRQVPYFLTREMMGGLPFEIAGGHIGDLVGKPVAEPHVHDVDEIYLLLSPEPGAAVIDVELNDAPGVTYRSPAAILVPAGVKHRFVTRQASQGSYCFGIFVLESRPGATP